MEMRASRPNDTTVGRVEVPPIFFSPAQHRSLAGALTGSHVAQANSARRRLHGPTLLQSPPRRGYSYKMGDIFSNTKTGISAPAIRVTTPVSSPRQLPLRPRPASGFNKERQQAEPLTQPVKGAVLYPALPQDAFPVSKPGAYRATSIPGLENGRQTYQTTRFYAQFQGAYLEGTAPRLSPAPGNAQHSYFDNPPTIASAQIVAMHEIETMQRQEDLSSSSASWTGDSEFYIPHRTLVLPPQERKSSIPEWLERLPAEPEEFEKDNTGDEEVVPLSPHVEIERGSMRKKMRLRDGYERRTSLTDEEVYTSHEQEE